MSKKIIYRIEAMLEAMDFIYKICEENGGIAQAVENRINGRPAIAMHLSLINEQFKKIQNENEMDSIKLVSKDNIKGILDTRNVIAHNYEGLDIDLLIDVIKYDLPLLKTELKEVLKNLEKEHKRKSKK